MEVSGQIHALAVVLSLNLHSAFYEQEAGWALRIGLDVLEKR
jgi:hypothetical protein